MSTLNKAVHTAGIVGGFLGAGIAVVGGILFAKPAFVIWGAAFAVCAVVGLVSGSKASPRGGYDPPSAGAKYTEVPDWAWYVAAAAIVVAIIFTFILPPWA